MLLFTFSTMPKSPRLIMSLIIFPARLEAVTEEAISRKISALSAMVIKLKTHFYYCKITTQYKRILENDSSRIYVF